LQAVGPPKRARWLRTWTLKSRYADEKDLRVLAKDILAAHALVESVNFADAIA